MLTHLHVDHVGWNMLDGEPFFPNARYVAQQRDFDWITGARPDRPYVRDNVLGLQATGRLELVSGAAEPLPGVRLLPTGGHTPGHCLVEVEDATLVGDLAVHERQLADPGLAYVAEEDQAAIAAVGPGSCRSLRRAAASSASATSASAASRRRAAASPGSRSTEDPARRRRR